MTSTIKTVSRKQVKRTWTDLDPKVAVLAIIVIVCDLVLAYLWVTGRITTPTFTAGLGPSGVGTLAAYLRTSSHAALVEQGETVLKDAEAIAPAVEAAVPAVAPVIDGVESIITALADDEPAAPAAPAADAPAPTTATLVLTAPRSATAGGQ